MQISKLRFLLGAVIVASVSFAHAADASADFSIGSNPNGFWSYGYSSTATSSMTLDTANRSMGPLIAWTGEIASDGNPSVWKNTSGSSYTAGTVTWQPDQMIMHPGPGGEYSVVRYTALSSGMFSVGASFIGQDSTSTDVHLVKNGVSLFDGAINGYLNSTSTSQMLNLMAGDTLDIRVGFGSNGTFFNDSTGANLTVNAVPEPCTMIVSALGAALAIRRRKRKQA